MGQMQSKPCKGCGVPIFTLKTSTIMGRVMVEAEPVWVKLATGGDSFYTADGRGIYGQIAGDADDDPDSNFVEAYIPHRGRCPHGGKAPRNRKPRPSGYR